MPELVTHYVLPTAGTVGPDTEYPVAVGESQLIEWRWRVRSWTFAYDLNFRIESEAYNFNIADEAIFTLEFASELDLPCGAPIFGNILFDGLDIGGGFTVAGGFSLFLLSGSPDILLSSPDQYPYLLIQGGFAVPEVAAAFSASTTRDAPSDPVEAAVVTVDGVAVTMYSLGFADVTLLSGTITATPETYWGYDGVVSTVTGAALDEEKIEAAYYIQCPCE